MHAIRSRHGEQFIDEVLQAEAESQLDLTPVFISVAPEHFFAAATAGIIFDEANRFRPNGIFLSEGAVRYLEESGVPVTRVSEEPGRQRVVKPTNEWVTDETEREDNTQDAVQGEIIRAKKRPTISERAHRKVRTSPVL